MHLPDLYDGQTFETLDDGLAHARSAGFEAVQERGGLTAEDLPPDLVCAGMSLGNMSAQLLARSGSGW